MACVVVGWRRDHSLTAPLAGLVSAACGSCGRSIGRSSARPVDHPPRPADWLEQRDMRLDVSRSRVSGMVSPCRESGSAGVKSVPPVGPPCEPVAIAPVEHGQGFSSGLWQLTVGVVDVELEILQRTRGTDESHRLTDRVVQPFPDARNAVGDLGVPQRTERTLRREQRCHLIELGLGGKCSDECPLVLTGDGDSRENRFLSPQLPYGTNLSIHGSSVGTFRSTGIGMSAHSEALSANQFGQPTNARVAAIACVCSAAENGLVTRLAV